MSLELTNEQKIVLDLAAKTVSEEPFKELLPSDVLKTADWKLVAKETNTQAILLSALEVAQVYKEYIPENLYVLWQDKAFTSLAQNFKVLEWQKELVSLLEKENLKYLIIKGTSASAYYSKPELRLLGDVDFLIEPKDRVRVEALLENNGYVNWKQGHECHVVFRKEKAHLEMHFEVAGIPYGKVGNYVREFLAGATQEWKDCKQEDVNFKAPTDMYHGLIILLHMQHHMLGEGLGLRHLCDYASYIQKTANESFWTETLIPFLKKIGLFRYAASMAKTCSLYLKTVCPNWAEDVEEELCEEIINDVLKAGNFGRKDVDRANSGMLVAEHGKSGTKHGPFYNLAHTLHRAVILQYPIIKKVPIVYPFLYCWKAIRFVFLSLIGKRPNLLKILPQADERKAVYQKLRIFEEEK